MIAPAAMEPAPGERDDLGQENAQLIAVGDAAMEPAPGERDDQCGQAQAYQAQVPQWSPLLVSGMTDWTIFRKIS